MPFAIPAWLTFTNVLKVAPYAFVAMLIIAVLWFRSEALKSKAAVARTQAELSTQVAVNKANLDQLKVANAAAQANAAIAMSVAAKFDTINKRTTETANTLAALEMNDAKVRDWANTPIPDSVRGVLNKQPAPAH